MPSSLCIAVESLCCQSLDCFLGYLCWCWCYLAVFVGWGELRNFLLHFFPRNPCLTSVYLTHLYCYLFFYFFHINNVLINCLHRVTNSLVLPNPVINSQGSFYLTYQDLWHGYSLSHWNIFFTWFPDLTLPGVPSSSSAQSVFLLVPPHLSNFLLISHLCLLYSLVHLIQSCGFKYLYPTAAWLTGTFGHFKNISNLTFPKPTFILSH